MSEALSVTRHRAVRYPSVAGGPVPEDAAGRPVCERALRWDGEHPHCGKPATVLTRAMCVHEHYGEGYACRDCLAEMRERFGEGPWSCEECWNGTERHDCPMPMQVTPLEES